jgi:hypothetical protein
MHQTDSVESRPKAVVANGTPLSVGIARQTVLLEKPEKHGSC